MPQSASAFLVGSPPAQGPTASSFLRGQSAKSFLGETDAEFVARTTPELIAVPEEPSYLSRRTSGAFDAPPWGDSEGIIAGLGALSPVARLALDTNIGRQAVRGATSDGGVYSMLGGIAEGVAGLPAGAGASGVLPGGFPQIVKDAANWYGEGVDLTRGSIRRALPVEREFATSTLGGVTQGVGQMGATLPIATLGLPAVALASAGQTFDEAFQEAKAAGLDDAAAYDVALKYLPSAGADFLADTLLAGKVLRPTRAFSPLGVARDVAGVTAAGAGSEALQTRWLNEIARDTYDPTRAPNEGVGQSALVGGIVPAGITTARTTLDMLGPRIADKTPVQALKAIREEAKIVEDKAISDQLTDTADTLEREIQAREAANKAQADAQKLAEQQTKEAERLQAEAQKAAQAALAPPEIPKSAQILAEPTAKPPSIANVATEIATQTENSPFALQNKLNELTAAPAPPQQIAGPTPGAGIEPPSAAGEIAVPTLEQDIAAFKANQKRFNALAKKGEIDTPEFQEVFRLNEEIKNRHGGMPPTKGEPTNAPKIESPATVPIRDQPEIGAGIRQPDPLNQGVAGARQEATQGNGEASKGVVGETERLVSAAVRTEDGTIYQGRVHAGAMNDAIDAGKLIGRNPDDEGFVTSTGRYVTREQAARVAENAGQIPKEAKFPRIGAEDIDLPLRPRSTEQRLNDANLGLVPVSQLSRAAKRAELDSAGVTTYKGKPLDDINPAELSSAVGKLRRGESLDLPPTDIIDRLTKAKIKTAGRAFDATAGIPIAAYNAAIDTAIVAIRAGRALAEVVAMAIDRYRKMHPRATDAEVLKLSQDIEVAHGYGVPTPKMTEVEQIVSESAPIAPVAGRSSEATQKAAAMRRGLIAGSAADLWADQTIKRIQSEGRQLAGFDPELGAATTIKLMAQLEKGVVDFAKWSAEQIKEFGETIKPHLQKIWDTAHARLGAFPQPVQSGSPEFRGRSESSLLEYDTVAKSTNAAKIQYAEDFVKWHEANGTPDTAINEMRKIQDAAFKAVVAARLLKAEFERSMSGNVAEKAMIEDRIQRLLGNIATDKSQAGQALQAQAPVNDILEPYSAELALRGFLKRRLDEVGTKFGADASGAVNEGFRAAGNEAANRIDAPGAGSLLSGPINRIRKAVNINWRDIFTDLPENQEARKIEIFARIKADPKIAALPESTQVKLAESMEKAWETLRNRIFRSEFRRLVPLPNVKETDKVILEESLPELTRQANLGLLDNEAFLNALAAKYGIEPVDVKVLSKLRELGQKAARTPEGSERNEVFQEIMDTIMQARGINPWDFMKDFWYRSVMSAPRTALEIGFGGVVQGAARTLVTSLDTASVLRRPDIAARMIGMFLRDMGRGIALGADLIRTGDRSILPRYTEQFLAKMARLERGEAPGGEIESIYRRAGPLGKTLLFGPEMVGRLLTALDYIGGQGIRSQQMLYSALVKKDKASFDAAMKQFNAKAAADAEKQARTELGPDARYAQVIARQREILSEGIDREVQKYGNQMTEVAALNAPPVGIGGLLYNAVIARLPMWVKAPAGLAFAKAGLNLMQDYSNWMPVTGQINAARALWREPAPSNPFRHLALDKIPAERARQIIWAQGIGLALTAIMANKFLSDEPEDKEGRQRKWEISGSWAGLSPQEKSNLLSAGEKPYAVKLPSGRWVDYKLTPLVGAFAIIGNMRDQQRFNQKKWDDKTATAQVANSWLMGLASIKDLSVSSQAARLFGVFSQTGREVDEKSVEKNLTDALANSASGFVPMVSLLREVDYYFDQQRYRPDDTNPGADLWMKQVPFVRRLVSRSPDGTDKPMLNFLGEPVRVVVTPYNRHIGELPSLNPVERALSEKVSMGMSIPTLSEDTSIVTKGENGKLEQRPMTAEEGYFYQKSVRQAFARQIAMDLPAFQSATPTQAALYAQAVFSDKERYVRDRMNTGVPFDGVVPADPRLSGALSADYQRIKELDASEAAPSSVARSRLRIAHDRVMGLPPEQRRTEFATIMQTDPEFGVKLMQYVVSPAQQRDVLEKAEAALGPETRAQFIDEKMQQGDARTFLRGQAEAGLLTGSTAVELAKRRRGQPQLVAP